MKIEDVGAHNKIPECTEAALLLNCPIKYVFIMSSVLRSDQLAVTKISNISSHETQCYIAKGIMFQNTRDNTVGGKLPKGLKR